MQQSHISGFLELVEGVLMLVMGRASIHLENLLIATSKWVKPPVVLFNGPTRSSPQTTLLPI
jgi:hypothetical protein